MNESLRNFRFPDHDFIIKKDSIKFYPRFNDGTNQDLVVKKGDSIQLVKDAITKLPLTVCLKWDFKKRTWILAASCEEKGFLKI